MWPQIALFIASLVISYMLQPKPQKNKPAAFEDFDFPTVDDGTPQIVVFGDVWLTDWTVIGVGNYRNETIVAKQSGLFGSKKADAGFRYFMSIHMGLSRAIDDMIEIKISDRTVWTGNLADSNESTISINQPDIFGGDKGEGGIAGQLKVLRGAADQSILNELAMMYGTVIQEGYYSYEDTGDGYYSNGPKWIPPVIEPGVVPAYRGVVTFFYDGLICSNSPYPKPWSFRVRRTVSGWDGSVWYPEKATIWLNDNKIKAMNAAHILYEAQTNRMWGRGFSASQLDLDSYKSVADQLYAEGFGICLAWRRQENLSEFMQQIINQIGAAQFVDRTTGLWKLVLIRDNYVIADLQTFSNSTGLLRVEDDNNASNDLVTNLTVVTYRDPITNQDQQIRAENLAAIQKNGAILENKTYSGIPTASLAGRLAARDMKISQSSLKKFKLILDRRAYAIQPASVFKIALPERGIDSIVVRAVRVEHDTITNGEITVTVIQDVFGLPATNYIQEQPNLWQPPMLTVEEIKIKSIFEIPYLFLIKDFSEQQLQIEQSNKGFIAVAAERPNGLHLDFDIMSKLSTDENYRLSGIGNFVFTSLFNGQIAQTSAITTVELIKRIDPDQVIIGDCALVDDEIIQIKSYNSINNTITFSRGCSDTVPTTHSNTHIFFFDNISISCDRIFNADDIVKLKLLPRTSRQKLAIQSAPEETVVLKRRLAKPYPPANVKLNDIAYPTQLAQKLLKIEWSERNRIEQKDKIVDQLGITTPPEENTTYTLKVYKKTQTGVPFSLVSELKDLTTTVAYANDDSAVSPGQNDFYRLTESFGRLSALTPPFSATNTTQRLLLARPQVGQHYGLTLNPNRHGANGFDLKHVEEEFLATDTSMSFLNRLKTKIMSGYNALEKKALKFGLYHSQTCGWRCEGVSGRILEITPEDPTAMTTTIHFVLYDAEQNVLFHHQLTNAYLGKFYFDTELERCFLSLNYAGNLDLNKDIPTNITGFRTFSFEDIQANGIAFTRPPVAVAMPLQQTNFVYRNGLLWMASPSTGLKAPIHLLKFDIETLELLVEQTYLNSVVNSTSPASDRLAESTATGSIILTDEYLYFAEESYIDERYPDLIRFLPQTISTFSAETGSFIKAKFVPENLNNGSSASTLLGKYFTDKGAIRTRVDQWGGVTSVYDNKFKQLVYDYSLAEMVNQHDVNYKAQTFKHTVTQETGLFQFYSAGINFNQDVAFYKTDLIYDTRTWNAIYYKDTILIKNAMINAAPEHNKVGFPEAAFMDIEFDVSGAFYFETTSSAEAGTGPNGAVLFADVSDAIAVKVEVWSVRDGLDSWQKQVLEVPVQNQIIN